MRMPQKPRRHAEPGGAERGGVAGAGRGPPQSEERRRAGSWVQEVSGAGVGSYAKCVHARHVGGAQFGQAVREVPCAAQLSERKCARRTHSKSPRAPT